MHAFGKWGKYQISEGSAESQSTRLEVFRPFLHDLEKVQVFYERSLSLVPWTMRYYIQAAKSERVVGLGISIGTRTGHFQSRPP